MRSALTGVRVTAPSAVFSSAKTWPGLALGYSHAFPVINRYGRHAWNFPLLVSQIKRETAPSGDRVHSKKSVSKLPARSVVETETRSEQHVASDAAGFPRNGNVLWNQRLSSGALLIYRKATRAFITNPTVTRKAQGHRFPPGGLVISA